MRVILLVAVLLLLSLASVGAHAHADLERASPRVGSTVPSSPQQVTLTFTQNIEPKFSRGEVRNAAGARIDRGVSVSGRVMRINVQTLPPGTYRVTWRVLSVDTHTTQGSFSFSVSGR